MSEPGVFAVGDRVRIIADTGNWVYPDAYRERAGIAVSVQQFRKYRRWLVDYGESGFGRHQIREEHLERTEDYARVVVPQAVLSTAAVVAAPRTPRKTASAQPWTMTSLWDQPPDDSPSTKAATRVATKKSLAPAMLSFRERQAALLPQTVRLAGVRPKTDKGPEIVVLLDEDGALYMPAFKTYSSGDILTHDPVAGRIRRPMVILGSRWVCDMGGGAIPWKEVKAKTPDVERSEYSPLRMLEVIPIAGYQGPTISPDEWFREVDENKRSRGDLSGVRVKQGQSVYVLSDAELWIGYRQVVAEVGETIEPVGPNLEVETADPAHAFLKTIEWAAISATYSYQPHVAKVFPYEGALWVYRGAEYSFSPSRKQGESLNRFFCDEVVPLSAWRGPTRQGDQHIRGETPLSRSKRGVLVVCDADKSRYVLTGRTLTISRRKSA